MTSRRKLAGTNSHKSFLLQKRFLPVKASLYQKALVNQSHFFCFLTEMWASRANSRTK